MTDYIMVCESFVVLFGDSLHNGLREFCSSLL